MFQQIVWVNNAVDFYVDPNALPVADQLVLPNIELFRNVDYSISNYNLLKGKGEILNQINHKISGLNFGIQSLEQNLKNNKYMAVNYSIEGTINNTPTDFLLIVDKIDTPNSKTLYTTNLYTIELFRGTPKKILYVENILSKRKIHTNEELPTFLDCLIEIEKFNITKNIKFISGFTFDSIPVNEIYFQMDYFLKTGSPQLQ